MAGLRIPNPTTSVRFRQDPLIKIKMRIAFDIDDTLFKLVLDEERTIPGVGARCICGVALKQEPDEYLVQLAHQLITNPDNQVYLWSAGGVDHVNKFIDRYCPAWKLLVNVIVKAKGQGMDICFDDQNVDLAEINLRVKREHADHWEGYDTGVVTVLDKQPSKR